MTGTAVHVHSKYPVRPEVVLLGHLRGWVA